MSEETLKPDSKTWQIPRPLRCIKCKKTQPAGTEMEWVKEDRAGRETNVLHCKECAKEIADNAAKQGKVWEPTRT